MKNPLLMLTGAAILAVTSWVVADDDPILDAIKARKAHMQLVKWNAGPLFGMAKGEVDYNAELAAALAENLKALSIMNDSNMWPNGSDNEAYPDDTRSLPSIWADGSEIDESNQAWADASSELAAVAGSGVDQLRGKIGALGKSCKGCHDDYRAE